MMKKKVYAKVLSVPDWEIFILAYTGLLGSTMDFMRFSTLTPLGYPVGGSGGHFRHPTFSQELIEPVFSPIRHPWAAPGGVFGGHV